jgi:hypothetical protein
MAIDKEGQDTNACSGVVARWRLTENQFPGYQDEFHTHNPAGSVNCQELPPATIFFPVFTKRRYSPAGRTMPLSSFLFQLIIFSPDS